MEDDKAAAEAESHETFSNQLQVERQAAADAVEGMKTELDAALAEKKEVDEESRKMLLQVRLSEGCMLPLWNHLQRYT